MISDMRLEKWTLVIFALGALILLLVMHPWRPSGSPQETRFLQWETCVLNDGPHCGPQPVP
jgi:hypothetical protein